MDLSQIVAMKAKKQMKALNDIIASSSDNIKQSSNQSLFSHLDARLSAIESDLLPNTISRLSEMTASNAIVLNETFLMLTTVANFNRNRSEFTKLLYDGLADASGFDLVNSTNSSYDNLLKQITVQSSGVLYLLPIDCKQNAKSLAISLGILSGSCSISIRKSSQDAWLSIAENEWVDVDGLSSGNEVFIKLNCSTATVLNGISMCWN